MRRTTLAAAALIPACALALSACGSKSANSASAGATATVVAQNNAHLTQAQLMARFKTALASATALHMKGSMTDSGSTVSMDMQINKSGTAQGTITASGMTMPIISIGSTTYIQITPSYASMIKSTLGAAGGDAGIATFFAQLADGKWIKSTADSSLTGGMGSLTDFSQMTKQLADTTTDTFTYLGTSTVDGQAVAQYKDVSTDGSPTATMSIPLTGSPLPTLEDAGTQGSMVFTWDQPTTITAPPAAEVVTAPSSLLDSASDAPSAMSSSS
jgi:hypothetical protein